MTEFTLIEKLDTGAVDRLVRRLPRKARDELRAGPWPEPHCGVCRALNTIDMTMLVAGGPTRPAAVLLDYHDTPWRRGGRRTHRIEGREVYARCCEIYRAAGWEGEPAPWGMFST